MIIDPTLRGDTCADEMREAYEANKPLRWWQRRKKVSENGNADNLMLQLQNVVHRHYSADELEGLLQESLVKLVDVQGCLAPKDFARNLISRINRIFAQRTPKP